MKKIFLFFLFFSLFNHAQDCESRIKKIYNDVINSIGNNFPAPPNLIISDNKRIIAYLGRDGITIGKTLIDLFCDDKNFDDKIAYVISHELAHHYLSHNWTRNTNLGYASSIGEFIDEQSVSKTQRKLDEAAADLFGGFFGQIAGYSVLLNGKEGLKEIYEHFKLPKEIEGYPSLDDRIEIIDSNIKKANKLTTLFNVGNILLMLGNYDEAKICFEDILRNNFTSREIFNNIGLVYLLKGISISDPKISKFIYPISIDFQTRADINSTRSLDLINDPNKLFNYAMDEFDKSIRLDKNYYLAKKNLSILNFIKAFKDGNDKKFIEKSEDFNLLDESTKADLKVISGINKKFKKKKLLKLSKGGSYISNKNIEYEYSKKSINFEKPNEKFKIDTGDFVFGLPKPNTKIKTKNRDLSITTKTYETYSLISIDNSKNSMIILKTENKYNFKNQISYKNNFYTILD
tara:strand:- start:142 stop:1524 length:1383 start_codon:yes stop_codon:yes gene_type:complete